MRQSILVFAFCAGLGAVAEADVKLVYQHFEQGKGGQDDQTIYLAPDQLRVDNEVNANGYVLFDRQTMSWTAVNRTRETYTRLTPAVLDTLRKEGEESSRRDVEKFEQRLEEAGLDESQKEQMRTMWKHRLSPAGVTGTGAALSFVPADRREEVQGHACSVVEVYSGRRRSAELCLATADDIGLPAPEQAVLRRFKEFALKLAVEMPMVERGLFELGDPADPRIPVRVIKYYRGGKVTHDELTKVSTEPLAQDLFAIPANLKEQPVGGTQAQGPATPAGAPPVTSAVEKQAPPVPQPSTPEAPVSAAPPVATPAAP